MPNLDVLAVAAHPDDAEIGCGGTLARFARLGLRAGILDLTRGELGSRGTVAERAKEAEEAASILGLAWRENLGLPDGGINPLDPEQRLRLVRRLRELRPTLVLIHWHEVRHPDHRLASQLAEEAAFRAGLHRIETGQPPFRPSRILQYMERYPFEPTLVMDVSADHETKMRAIRAHRSQFAAEGGDGEPETFLTRPAFLGWIEARAQEYGELAGFGRGEPFRAKGPLAIADPRALLVEVAG